MEHEKTTLPVPTNRTQKVLSISHALAHALTVYKTHLGEILIITLIALGVNGLAWLAMFMGLYPYLLSPTSFVNSLILAMGTFVALVYHGAVGAASAKAGLLYTDHTHAEANKASMSGTINARSTGSTGPHEGGSVEEHTILQKLYYFIAGKGQFFTHALFAIVVFHLVIFAGLAFFVLPGIILLNRLWVYPFLMVDRRLGIFEGLKTAWKMTSSYSATSLLFIVTAIFMNMGALVLSSLPLLFTLPITVLAGAHLFREMDNELHHSNLIVHE